MKPIIKLRNVSKIYTMGEVKVPALTGVSLEIRKGEFVSIMGPSGSGKSTLMYIIGCLDIPTRGKVFLEGHDVSRMKESDLAKIRGKKIGFIFQTFNLIQTLSAFDNVTLPMIFQDVSEEERMKRGRELLKLVKLEHRAKHRPTEMSGGEQQRVAIARALVNDPDVILADEPTGNLDSKTGKNILKFLNKINKEEGKTIVMITHDKSLARFAERIIHLKDGKIIKGGI
jgi:putative ABC transport system ATP-binding protein